MLLAGDIGGTKTVLALYTQTEGPKRPVVERTFPSARYPSLARIVEAFLADATYPIERASFGVAGPVIRDQAMVTNLSWVINIRQLQELLGAPVTLLNDLQAIASAVPILGPEDLFTLNQGEAVPGGAIAVVAPGTGLGEAYLTWDGGRYHAYASEGGHTDFAPTNAQEIDLLRFMRQRMDHVSYEWVCSGIGIPNLYAFLKETGAAVEPAWLTEKLAAAADKTPVIVSAALQEDPPCELARAALQMFVSILGAEAGNLALKVLATGGVFIGGGIPPRILPALQQPDFMRSFLRKGRFAELLHRMPIHIVLNNRAALIGAAHHALSR